MPRLLMDIRFEHLVKTLLTLIKERSSYIATQAPLDNTTDDFWRMIWEYNVTMIVMLTKLSEKGRTVCSQYWPDEKKTRFTYFIVEPTTQFKCDGYVIR